MEEEEQTLILSKSQDFLSVNIFGRLIVCVIYMMYCLLAPPELDETGNPRSFHKDELLQFLRVCLFFFLN